VQPRIIFITGTDTGVGKTLLTGLLLHHLLQSGCHALAMKPFCSGGMADVEFLHAVLEGELKTAEINPFYFSEPIAPLIAARLHHRKIQLSAVLSRIQKLSRKLRNSKTPVLLIEGSGGLLVPLGEGYTVADLIANLGCEVVVSARNRLGTINHTLLTVQALQRIGIQRLKVVLMARNDRDLASETNRKLLLEILAPIPVLEIGFLGPNAMDFVALKKNAKKVKKTLAQILR
jgi:dethiobiotin synthetase